MANEERTFATADCCLNCEFRESGYKPSHYKILCTLDEEPRCHRLVCSAYKRSTRACIVGGENKILNENATRI